MTQSSLASFIVGDSPSTRELRALIARVAPLGLPVLIEGPTGSGKELVAQALHALSGRPGRCVAFNVCAVAESMFEDALFGHVRGAFTSAVTDTPGYLTEADKGTIFLDEVGGLALPLQAKLLRVIETGEFRPVGGRTDSRSDFRVVAAINEPLDELIADGRFRTDLAHRLAGVVIPVAPLRERPGDIPALVRHFTRLADQGDGVPRFGAGAMRALRAHDWPGNVRELKHVVERVVALAGRRVLGRDDVLAALRPGRVRRRPASDAFERRRLVEVLEACGWDTALAADRLDVHRATVYRRMRRLDVTAPQGQGGGGEGRERANGGSGRSHG